jgi:hypothetical protein
MVSNAKRIPGLFGLSCTDPPPSPCWAGFKTLADEPSEHEILNTLSDYTMHHSSGDPKLEQPEKILKQPCTFELQYVQSVLIAYRYRVDQLIAS